MAGKRPPWRALRPVLLAGAATLTWLTFSAATASADTLPDATSLLGGVTSSVSSVADKLPVSAAGSEAAAPATSAPAPGSSSGMLQPSAGEISGLTDQIVSSGPAVNHGVPAGTVSAIAVPIAQLTDAATADAATADAAEAVVPPVTEALPVIERVLQPVADVVAGTAALPLPELPVVTPVDEVHPEAARIVVQALPAQLPATTVNEAGSEVPTAGTFEVPRITAASVGSVAVPPGVPLQAAISPPTATEEQPRTGDPASAPPQAAPASGSGTGSGAASAGSSGSAACLSVFTLDLPPSGAARASEASEHAPAPVSFDPGSSPD